MKRQGLCEDVQPTKPSIEYCSIDLTLKNAGSKVNPLLVDSVLCVAVDNNEVVGDYIAEPPEKTMSIATAFQQNPKEHAFTTTDDVEIARSVDTPGGVYEPGDFIRVFASSSQDVVRGPYLMGWAAVATSSKCSQRNPVRFEFDWEESSCVQDNLVLEEVCGAPGGPLDPSSIAPNLLIAKTPSVTSGSSVSTEIVIMDVTLQEVDVVTGQTNQLAPPYPSYYPLPHLRNNTANNSICEGALFGVAYTVYHNGSGLIERASALVTIGALSTSEGSSTASLWQSFSVRFVSTAEISRSLEQGNLQTYERSGNPGYLMHRPVRVGILSSSANASMKATKVISEMTGGLVLPALGDCSDTLETPILFGEDSYLTCTLPLNATEFKSFCERDSPVVADALRVRFSHVAMFGNSNPFLVDDWLTVDYDEPTKATAVFADATGAGNVEMQCKNVFASLHIEFLVAAVGPANNPQDKIVASRAFHGKDTWTFWKNPHDQSKQETYLLTTTVSFVQVHAAKFDQWIPPTPPIWFSIPNDVFYPFILNNADRTARSAAVGWMSGIWIVWVFS